jgi:transposase-like protein
VFVPRYTEAELREVVQRATSMTEVLRHFGLRPAGGNHKLLRRWIEKWNISTGHFVGTPPPRRRDPIPLEEVLVPGSTYKRHQLKQRLYDGGLKQRACELCGQGEEWHGRRMSLILDHINGVADDNRLVNLRIVCPNCAATLETHCGRANLRTVEDQSCLRCGETFRPKSSRQRYCSRDCGMRWARAGRPIPGGRRVERPPYEELVAEVAATSWSAVGRKYGVSDNAVRKWVRAYERERAGAEGVVG